MAKEQKQSSSRCLQCLVQFLDDSEAEFEIEKRDKAQLLLNKVFDHLDITERKYFGLQFEDSISPEENASGCSNMELMRWVDPAKSLKKQIKTFPPYFFYFRVKFYVPDPDFLAEEYTRYYFFLQLNKDLTSGKLKAQQQDIITLTGLAVQSDLGDYNPEEVNTDYLFGATFMPDQSEDFLKKVSNVHKRLKGLRPAVCEKKFLAIVKNFDGYGVNLYKANLEQTNEEIQLGVTSQGLVMFKKDVKVKTFIWAKIVKLSFKRKFFFIHLHKESPADDTVENVFGFHMTCYRTCKNLWKSCVEHHTFFCLHGQLPLPSLTTSSTHLNPPDPNKQSSDSVQILSNQSAKPSPLSASLHRDSPKFDRAPFHPPLAPPTPSSQQPQSTPVIPATNDSSHQQQFSAPDGKISLSRSGAFRSSPLNVLMPEQPLVAYQPRSAFNSPSEGQSSSCAVVVGKNKSVVDQVAAALSSSSHPSSPLLSPSQLHNGSGKNNLSSASDLSFQSSKTHHVLNSTDNFAELQFNARQSEGRRDGNDGDDDDEEEDEDATERYDNFKNSYRDQTRGGSRFVGVQTSREEPRGAPLRATSRHNQAGGSERRRTFESRPVSHRPNDEESSEEEEGKIVEKTNTNIITTLSPVVLVTNSSHGKLSDDKNASKDGLKMPRNSSSNCLDGLKTVRMKPDAQGRFGFNVKGGADQMQPIIVSRVAPDSSAGQCLPKLCEGDHVLFINGRDVSQHTHAQVVQYIRASREIHSGELVLVVRPMVYSNDLSPGEPDFQYIPDTHHIVALLNPGEDKLAASITQLKESIESKAGILQFEQLYRKRAGMSMCVSQLPENLARNRYRDISPYDLTRVRLQSTLHDYINATFVNMKIPGSGLVNHYIATQGPLPDTTSDFWTMVYEQGCPLVVMLTVTEERGHVKCHKYWPDLGTTMTFRGLDFSLTCLSESSPCPSFVCRYLVLTVGPDMQEHHVRQVQYVAWPDHGVPDDCTDFLDFVGLVRQTRKDASEPTVVHCSAGIGRTGVLIAMETAMCTIEADQPVHMLEIVKQMRDQRAMLIQTSSQYKFVCEAVIKVYDEKIVTPHKEYSC